MPIKHELSLVGALKKKKVTTRQQTEAIFKMGANEGTPVHKRHYNKTKKQLTSSSLLVSLKDFSNVSILCILALSVSS